MFDFIIQPIASWIVDTISTTGYPGIFFLMLIESACIPLPSEITMPFAGSLVATGRFNLFWLSTAGALGNLAGSLIAYGVGYWGEETFVHQLVKKYGKYILLSEKELITSETWFRKHGEIIVFASRLLPAVRTFISLPAGMAKMNLTRFILYTTAGSFLWSFVLAYVGVIFGKNWEHLHTYFQKFDLLIVALGIGAVVFYVWHKVKKS
jgi:membrane protein DedA with SNARE-associated domain